MQQRVPTDINQIFSCFMGRWRIHQHHLKLLLVGISVSIKTEDEKVKKVEETSLKCSHEEMDSRMLFHAKFINAPNTLVIRTVDADILVISLCNMPKLFQGLKAWLEVCLPSNNILWYMNMNKINQSLACKERPRREKFWSFFSKTHFSKIRAPFFHLQKRAEETPPPPLLVARLIPLKKLSKNAMVFSEIEEKETDNKN